ncbi:MAG: MarR family transcriptional regulator [Lachnospiraceae bacterium]|nr:MarR family transcriptional regulator [Candidatus Merdinaster equi]
MEAGKPKRKVNTARTKSIDMLMANVAANVLNSEAKMSVPKEFHDITENDVHIIEAVGISEPRKSSEIARKLGVTAGTLTVNLNSLEKKGYVVRKRSSLDKRVVYVILTDKGKKAFMHHKNVHNRIIRDALKDFSEMELDILHSCLEKLDNFFNGI